jgi:hypothetical protein
MSVCPQCDNLQHAALVASKAYHQVLGDLEAVHILRNSEAPLHLSVLREKALQVRNAAIAELAAHESAHAQKKPAHGQQQLSKRQSA